MLQVCDELNINSIYDYILMLVSGAQILDMTFLSSVYFTGPEISLLK